MNNIVKGIGRFTAGLAIATATYFAIDKIEDAIKHNSITEFYPLEIEREVRRKIELKGEKILHKYDMYRIRKNITLYIKLMDPFFDIRGQKITDYLYRGIVNYKDAIASTCKELADSGYKGRIAILSDDYRFITDIADMVDDD